MLSFWPLPAFIMALAFMAKPLLSLSSQLSPFRELSPDIAPLLPSPGGAVPEPAGSSMPTIPSNPSPPNPDDQAIAAAAAGPDADAFPPRASLPVSAGSAENLVGCVDLAAFLAVFWLVAAKV